MQYVLDLSSNSFAGIIPPSLGKLSSLENLNLSHNNLSGRIPNVLSDMISLQFIDVSYNNLSGPIPSGKVFEQALANAFTGNKGLCGNATGLPSCSGTTKTAKAEKSSNKVRIIVIVPVVSILVLAIIIALYVVFYKKVKQHNDDSKSSDITDNSESLIWGKEGRCTFRDIIKATDDFDEKYCIGRGGFGSVYKAVLLTGETVAVKRIGMPQSTDVPAINRWSFENEIRTLTEVRHRNIIKLYGSCSKLGCLYLVYEYMEKGSIGNLLYSEDGAFELGWDTRLRIIQGLGHALSYLHHDCTPPIVHRDVSPNNILLESDLEPRLSDFGTARLLTTDSTNWTSVAGSYGYMAPGIAFTFWACLCYYSY